MDESRSQPPGCRDAAPQPRSRGLRAWLAHAFAVEPYDETSLSEQEKDVLSRLAARLHERKLGSAAILWIQSNRHMNWLSSQALVFFQPIFDITHPVLNGLLRNFGLAIPPADYPVLLTAFEKRYSVEYLIQQLEARVAGEAPTAQP